MQAKSVLYAAVGAPVVVARKVGNRVGTLKNKVSSESTNYTEVANKAIDDWAVEGEKVVTKISDGKVVDQVTSKVDLDQAKEQVTKLRDQLEDMLATWRQSFRPEETDKAETKVPAAKKPAAKKPAAKASASKATASKATAAKKPATKATASKATASKATAAKKPTAKTSAAKTTKASTAPKTSAAKPKAS